MIRGWHYGCHTSIMLTLHKVYIIMLMMLICVFCFNRTVNDLLPWTLFHWVEVVRHMGILSYYFHQLFVPDLAFITLFLSWFCFVAPFEINVCWVSYVCIPYTPSLFCNLVISFFLSVCIQVWVSLTVYFALPTKNEWSCIRTCIMYIYMKVGVYYAFCKNDDLPLFILPQ